MKNKNNIKKIILGSFLGILIGTLLGTSYAMFTYNSEGSNGKLIVGDIYMKYKETTADKKARLEAMKRMDEISESRSSPSDDELEL